MRYGNLIHSTFSGCGKLIWNIYIYTSNIYVYGTEKKNSFSLEILFSDRKGKAWGGFGYIEFQLIWKCDQPDPNFGMKEG